MVVKYKKTSSGFSLIESLIVISVFAILAVVATQSLALSLRGSRKSENLSSVQEDIDYSMGVMERNIRNAQSVNCALNRVDYVDTHGNETSFSCETDGDDGYIASGSGRLTGEGTYIACSGGGSGASYFNCYYPPSGEPASVSIGIVANVRGVSGADGNSISSSTTIFLRTY